MVSLNGFSLKVPECVEETSDQYVVMRHGQTYSVRLSNHHKDNGSKPCDADVYVDGEFIGSFRIPSGQNVQIERPEYSNQKFTAFKKDSPEAREAQINTGSSEMGLIKVVFRPGQKKVTTTNVHWPTIIDKRPWYPAPNVQAYAVFDYDNYINYNYGYVTKTCSSTSRAESTTDLIGDGTGLSEISNQDFNVVDSLDYDEPVTTLYLRLVFEKEEPKIRPLRRVYSTGIPRPL